MKPLSKTHSLHPENWPKEYRQMLVQIAYKKVSDYQIAEDLVQETFVAAWKARDLFRGECSEKTYLTGILRNKIIDFYRSRGRRPLVLASQSDQENDEFGNQEDLRKDLNPLIAAEKRDFMKQLNRAVEKLPGKMGKAFRLWLIQDLSTEEVTRILDISTSNLWVLIYRAKKALKAELASDWADATFS